MTIATGATAAAEAIKERFTPTSETLEDNMRQARRAMVQGRYAAEDAVAAAALQVTTSSGHRDRRGRGRRSACRLHDRVRVRFARPLREVVLGRTTWCRLEPKV